MIHGFARTLLSFIAATLLTYSLASVSHTQQVMAKLRDLDVTITTGQWIAVAGTDWLGLYLYLVVIGIGLAIAFATMAVVRRLLPVRSVGATVPLFAAGGTLAMLLILLSMRELTSLTPIAGSRGPIGMLLQCLAGFVGGVCFALLKYRANPSNSQEQTY